MQQEDTMPNFSDEDDEGLSVNDLLSNVSNGLFLIWDRSAGQHFLIYFSLLTSN